MAKYTLLAWLLVLPAATSSGQNAETYLSSMRSPIRMTAMSVYQRVVDEEAVSQVSFPLFLIVPVGTNMGVSIQTSPSSSKGDDLESIGGFSDAQVAFSYFGRLRSSSVGASLSLNLPSGRRALSSEEFRTSILLSQQFYGFRVPMTGQGLNVTPGLTWAVPLAETVVGGLAIGYQYRGSFEPLDSGLSYDPGDEIFFTLGIDMAIGESSTLSGDATLARYQTDTMDGVDQYHAGNKIAATIQLLRRFDMHELRVVGRYRTRAKGELPGAGGLVTEDQRTVPDHALLQASFGLRGGGAAAVTFLARARHYTETGAFPSMRLADFGVMPEYRITDQWRILSQFVFTVGDFSGFEGGFGVGAEF